MSFLLHSEALNCSPGTQRPLKPGMGPYTSFPAERSLKLALSGQMPESTMPMMIPSPAPSTVFVPVGPPSCSHSPPAASRPRNDGVEDVSTSTSSFGVTARTSACLASCAAWFSVSSAAKPLKLKV